MLEYDVDLSHFNSLRLPARAAAYVRVSQVAQLTEFCKTLPPGRRFILGGGSNLVFSGDYKGTVVHMALRGRELLAEDADAWYVAAAAGERWPDFVSWTLLQGWPGLENLSLIPGTVGASPIQNIGAYGLELAERFHALEALDLESGEVKTFDRADCRFAYRHSVFKEEGWHRSGRFAILRVIFRLPKAWQPIIGYAELARELEVLQIASPDPMQMAAAVIRLRQRKLPDPAVLPNVGSFFQNPVVDRVSAVKLGLRYPQLPRYPQADGRVKLAAGWLIEQVGWKGRALGPVGMYAQQALILVNHEPGHARGTDVGMLAEAVRADVKRAFGVSLIPEPVFL